MPPDDAGASAWSTTGCWVAYQPVVPPGEPRPIFIRGMLATLPAGTTCTGYAWR